MLSAYCWKSSPFLVLNSSCLVQLRCYGSNSSPSWLIQSGFSQLLLNCSGWPYTNSGQCVLIFWLRILWLSLPLLTCMNSWTNNSTALTPSPSDWLPLPLTHWNSFSFLCCFPQSWACPISDSFCLFLFFLCLCLILSLICHFVCPSIRHHCLELKKGMY